jgi:thioredoxin-related protein
MKPIALLIAASLSVSLTTQAQSPIHTVSLVETLPAQATAEDAMAQATRQAVAEHKNILLVFSASWCGPCHLFESFLKDSQTAPVMSRYFVIVRLDVGERTGDKRHADTPGAVALRASLKGADAGYPFLVMLDPAGKPIVNSFCPSGCTPPGENIGYPATPGEIIWFTRMLQRGAPAISAREIDTVQNWLNRHGPN